MLHYELRIATPGDFEFCFRLNEGNFRGKVERLRGWNEEAERNDMRRQFRAGQDQVIVVDGRPAGHLSLEENEEFLELRMIALLPEYQRRGLGTALIPGILEVAEAKRKPVKLWVADWNEGAIRLYLRLGFKIEQTVSVLEKQVCKLLMVVWETGAKR